MFYNVFVDDIFSFQIAHFRGIFDLFAEPNGRIALQDLYGIMHQFGPELELELVDSLLQAHSSIHNNTIEYHEFINLLEQYESIVAEKSSELMIALQHLSKVRNGVIQR